MALDSEIAAMAQGRGNIEDVRNAVRRLVTQRRVMRAYAQIFLKDGQLTEAGAIVLADVARAAGIGKIRVNATGDVLQFSEGRRAVALHILARLDKRQVERLARHIREASGHE